MPALCCCTITGQVLYCYCTTLKLLLYYTTYPLLLFNLSETGSHCTSTATAHTASAWCMLSIASHFACYIQKLGWGWANNLKGYQTARTQGEESNISRPRSSRMESQVITGLRLLATKTHFHPPERHHHRHLRPQHHLNHRSRRCRHLRHDHCAFLRFHVPDQPMSRQHNVVGFSFTSVVVLVCIRIFLAL